MAWSPSRTRFGIPWRPKTQRNCSMVFMEISILGLPSFYYQQNSNPYVLVQIILVWKGYFQVLRHDYGVLLQKLYLNEMFIVFQMGKFCQNKLWLSDCFNFNNHFFAQTPSLVKAGQKNLLHFYGDCTIASLTISDVHLVYCEVDMPIGTPSL